MKQYGSFDDPNKFPSAVNKFISWNDPEGPGEYIRFKVIGLVMAIVSVKHPTLIVNVPDEANNNVPS